MLGCSRDLETECALHVGTSIVGFRGILNPVVTDDSSSNPQLSRSAQGSREPKEVARVEGEHVVERQLFAHYSRKPCFCGFLSR